MNKINFLLLSAIGWLCCMSGSAHNLVVDGIYYNIISSTDKTVEVTFRGSEYYDYSNEYSGAVSIPETVTYNGNTYSVTSIGEYAFYGCSSLTSVEIPNSVTSIGGGAFYDCDGLTSVKIPNSVTSIGDGAFYNCDGLTSVEIPNSVTSIGERVFYYCSGLTSVVIPNSVTSIGEYAFAACYALTSVEIPNSVTSIGEYAFYGCDGLTSVEIPNSVTSIGDGAFYDCDGLTSVKIPNSVTSIGDGAFGCCDGLTSVNIPNSVTSIGERVFYDCSGLTSVVIPNSVTSIGEWAFYDCNGLTSVVIPNSVTSIGNGAFGGCYSLTSIVVEDGNSVYDSREGCNAIVESGTHTLIIGCKNTIIPNSVTSIGDGAFDGCYSLTSVVIPNSVTSIGQSAFYRCYSLTSVVIPNSVTSIGDKAFESCSDLTSVEIGNSVTSIGDYAFYGCYVFLTSVNIPNSVTSIGEYAFAACYALTSVEIGSGVTSIGDKAFSFCDSLTSIVVEDGNSVYDSREGCNAIVESGTHTLIFGCKNTIIPNSVTSIGDYAFCSCKDLTSVEIPNSVTSIGEYAFAFCYGLNSVTSLNPTPPTLSSSTFNMYDATLYVPSGAKAAYSEAEYWKNFTNIEELAPSIYELTDGEEYNEASVKTVNALTYTRTLPNLYWNALYVPFELPYDVIADRYDVAYINDVNGYDTDENGEIDDLAMEIIRIKSGTLKANYPYLIKAKTEADKAVSITVEDATLYTAEENAVDCSSVYQNYVVKGTYTKKTAEELAGKLAISTSGAWQPLAEGTALNPFRLYLSIENRDNSPLKVEPAAMSRMRIVERGETTGIEEVVPSQQREDVIFDLSGRRVKQPVKGGVYIVNGKKRIL